MISKQKILNTLNEIKEITDLELIILAEDGKRLIATCSEAEEEQLTCISKTIPMTVENDEDYSLLIYGENAENEIITKMAACQIRNLILSKTEAFDRNNFIQNVLLGICFLLRFMQKQKNFILSQSLELLS